MAASALAVALREEWPRVALGIVFLSLGLGALGLTLSRLRARDPILAWFGAFCTLYGARVLGQTEWLLLVSGIEPGQRARVDSLLLALAPLPAVMLFERLLDGGPLPLVRRAAALLLGQAALVALSDGLSGRPYTAVRVSGACVAVAAALAAVSLRRRWAELAAEQRAAACVFVAFAMLAAAGLASGALVPQRQQSSALVFAALVACLAWLVAGHVLASERRLAAVDSELAAARRIQAALLPRSVPRLAGVELAVAYRPMAAVAGDLYSFLPIDERRLGVLVADVSGHGVGAALIASLVKAGADAQTACAADPAALLSRLNESLRGSLDGSFVTCIYVLLDLEARRITLANAGHPRALRCHGASSALEVGDGGLPLGLFAEARYTDTSSAIAPGERVLLYTDGVIEAESRSGEPYGVGRLGRFLQAHSELALEAVLERLLGELASWTGQPGFADDLTLVLLELRPVP